MSNLLPVFGIDLGTSNSSVCTYGPEDRDPRVVSLTQETGLDQWSEQSLLPSVLYLATPEETLTSLPWTGFPETLSDVHVGAWAKQRAAEVPTRSVVSAKSWLCHGSVDRRAPILPWGSPEPKISPVEASRWILTHLRAVLERNASGLLSDALVTLTVPASFDEVARRLTLEAAELAGIKNVRLLEEPQAAFYGWLASQGDSWRQHLQAGDRVLVVDVGGGTTDLSLISVEASEGDLKLERLSVGDHLLLGGDNMDLALAAVLGQHLELENSVRLDAAQWLSLTQAARSGKELLLGDDTLASTPISIVGRGSSLFSSALSTELSREQVDRTLLEGFFPLTEAGEFPKLARRTGLRELGLPYVHDAAITRHLAKFLAQSAERSQDADGCVAIGGVTFARPTAVLFNGGVFKAAPLRERLVAILNQWFGSVRVLETDDYELAVARGAALYAHNLDRGTGIRIKASTARSYYLGVEPSRPAVPGRVIPIQGLCVVPQGIEEGTSLRLEDRPFGLLTGETVEFRFFSSAGRSEDRFGDTVEDAETELEETASLSVTLEKPADEVNSVVAVQLEAAVTEVGTLELTLRHPKTGQQWDLEFNVRPHEIPAERS